MKNRIKGFQSGFTLIELLIVIVIVGIVAAIAIPNYLNYQCKAKQIEAKRNLGQLFTMELAYRSEYSTYTSNLTQIGWSIQGTPRYTCSITLATTTQFVARASANLDNDLIIDIWTMDSSKNLVNSTNDCS